MRKAKIEHLALWKKYKQAKTNETRQKFRNELVLIYYPIVEKISWKVAEALEWNVTPEELSSFGVEGLFDAIEKFELDAGVKFVHYASFRIKGSMIDGVRKEDIVPRSVRINHKKLEQARADIESEKGGKAKEYEIIQRAGFDGDEYLKHTQKFHPISFSSLDGSNIQSESKQEDLKLDTNESLIDHNSSSPDSQVLRREFLNKLISKNFSRIEKRIIYMYYYEGLTMEAIGRRLDMSESRISQIHQRCIPRLKDKVARNPKYFGMDITEVIEQCNSTGPIY